MPDTPRGILSALAYMLLGCAVGVYAALHRDYIGCQGRETLMQPDATPERDTAAQEARLTREIRGEAPPEPWRLSWSNVLVLVLGLALAVGLYALHLGQS